MSSDYDDYLHGLDGDPMDDWDDDGYQAYKDGVATGLINEDGTQREPDEPDFGREEWERYAAMPLPDRLWYVIRSVASAWWWMVRECFNPTSDKPPF